MGQSSSHAELDPDGGLRRMRRWTSLGAAETPINVINAVSQPICATRWLNRRTYANNSQLWALVKGQSGASSPASPRNFVAYSSIGILDLRLCLGLGCRLASRKRPLCTSAQVSHKQS